MSDYIETGKRFIQAGEVTEYIEGIDLSNATVIMEGTPESGVIYLEARVERELPIPGEEMAGIFGLDDDVLEELQSQLEEAIVVAETFIQEGVSSVFLNSGIQYRFRASDDFVGDVTVYMGAGGKYDKHDQ